MRQGCCQLPAAVPGKVLDRLLLLEQVIGPDGVQQALRDTACFDSRSCTLTREVTFWIVLAMGIWTELPIRQVFKAARRLRAGEATPHRSSLCVARQRLGLAPVRRLFAQTVRPLATPDTPGAFYKGWRLMALDGTVESVPDSEANAAAFGYPDGGHRGRGGRAGPPRRRAGAGGTAATRSACVRCRMRSKARCWPRRARASRC